MYSKQYGIVVHNNNTDGNATNDKILSNKNIISLIIFQDGLSDWGGGTSMEIFTFIIQGVYLIASKIQMQGVRGAVSQLNVHYVPAQFK